MRHEGDEGFPFDRPKLFDRMERLGEPAIAGKLAELDRDTTTSKWLRVLLRLAPSLREQPSKPIWRLLDPTPIGNAEWADVAEPFKRWMYIFGARPPKVWTVQVTKHPLFPATEYHVVRQYQHSLNGLTYVLLSMRHHERKGDLTGYYLNLLEAIERCRDPMPKPCMAVLKPDCGRFLADCFGHVHIGHGFPGRKFDDQLLSRARSALEQAKQKW